MLRRISNYYCGYYWLDSSKSPVEPSHAIARFYVYGLLPMTPGGGGCTDLERGYGYVRPWRPPFHAPPAVHKGPISSKVSVHKAPFWENLEILASTASIFCPNFSY